MTGGGRRGFLTIDESVGAGGSTGTVRCVCGRFTSRTPIDDVVAHFGVDEVVADDLGARYNVAPTDPVYAVVEASGARRLGTMRWGLIPTWADDPRVGSRMINARAETLATKPAFRRLLARRRCLVPADGFYEWRPAPPGGKKQPVHLRPRGGGLLAFAGLWDSWRSPEGERVVSCAIVTTPASEEVAPLHDRMPAVLDPGVWDVWLDPGLDDPEQLSTLLVPSSGLELVEVSTAVNDVRNDGPELLATSGAGGAAS
jgi:putative SOS response-associated peptidase YedK